MAIGLDDVIVGLRADVVAITLATIYAFVPQSISYVRGLRVGQRIYSLELAAGIWVSAVGLLAANIAILVADLADPDSAFSSSDFLTQAVRAGTFFLIPGYFMHVTAWHAVRFGTGHHFWQKLAAALLATFAAGTATSALLS